MYRELFNRTISDSLVAGLRTRRKFPIYVPFFKFHYIAVKFHSMRHGVINNVYLYYGTISILIRKKKKFS